MVTIAEADTGGGGVATLIGKANPLVEWGDPAMTNRPISTIQFPDAPFGRGSADRLEIIAIIDIFAEGGSGGLAEQVADRYEVIMTNANLTAQGLNVSPTWRNRRFLSELEEGGRRKTLEGLFLLNR